MTKTLYEICPIRFGPDDLHPFGCPNCNGTGFVPTASVVPPVDHGVLDIIADVLNGDLGTDDVARNVTRESECVEFTDGDTGTRYEIVVRDIHSWREPGKSGERTEAVTDKMVSAAVSSAIGFGLLSGYWKCTEKEREGWALVFRNVIEAALKAQGRE